MKGPAVPGSSENAPPSKSPSRVCRAPPPAAKKSEMIKHPMWDYTHLSRRTRQVMSWASEERGPWAAWWIVTRAGLRTDMGCIQLIPQNRLKLEPLRADAWLEGPDFSLGTLALKLLAVFPWIIYQGSWSLKMLNSPGSLAQVCPKALW